MGPEMRKLWDRLRKPLIGLGAIGISTTLAACYGPPPNYVENGANGGRDGEYCEQLLRTCVEGDTVPQTCESDCVKAVCDGSAPAPACCNKVVDPSQCPSQPGS